MSHSLDDIDTHPRVKAFRTAIDNIIEKGEDSFFTDAEGKPICGLCGALARQGFGKSWLLMHKFMQPDPMLKYCKGIGPSGVLNEERIFVVLLLDQLSDEDILELISDY